MELKTTSREEFLINIALYLINGNDSESNGKRNQSEVEAILNNPKEFFNIDIIDDELSYFSLERSSFEWR